MSLVPYRWRPSAGFALFVAVLCGTTGFFAWAGRTPPLDDVWRMQLELRLGERGPLSGDEFATFQRTLQRHPGIAAELVHDGPGGLFSANDDGRVEGRQAYLVRATPQAAGNVRVSVDGGRGAFDVSLRTAGTRADGQASAGTPFVHRLPDSGPFPQLVELRFEPRAQGQTPPRTALRIETVQ